MWIRSQSKKRINDIHIKRYYKKDNVYYSGKMKCTEGMELIFVIKRNDYFLGEYSSEEKALKVLDMIQNHINEVDSFEMGNDGFYHDSSILKTFQMPLDEEVVL